MKRDPRLARLSEEHHHGLVFAVRIEREVPAATDDAIARLYVQLLQFWTRGLLPHFRTEGECLLARIIRHRPVDDPLIARVHADHLSMAGLVAEMNDAENLELRKRALSKFGSLLKTHIRWEEHELFEVTQEILNDEELSRLGDEIAERHPKADHVPWDPS